MQGLFSDHSPFLLSMALAGYRWFGFGCLSPKKKKSSLTDAVKLTSKDYCMMSVRDLFLNWSERLVYPCWYSSPFKNLVYFCLVLK